MFSPLQSLSRRSFLKRAALWGGSFLASGGAAGSYAAYVEPRWIETIEQRVQLRGLPQAFAGKRIVHISDIHLGFHMTLRELQAIAGRVQRLQPDMLVFTGDLFDSWISEDPQATAADLAALEAPLGKWAVLGNHDTYAGLEDTKRILQAGGFTVLDNAHALVRLGADTLVVAGVADMWTGYPDLQRALDGADPQLCTLLLSHCANFADEAAARPEIALQLSGHSHGGQIRLPLLGAVETPPYGDKYVSGLHTAANSQLLVYTTRGLGMTLLPFRFLCRPEITVLTLDSKQA
ncbi:metallophosphoesterase [Paenibacillus athensensis]|uniref:Calcineurin-like phosphoesterase domain-containing protein n=1 Tax=Paenibacillus athensensis TaxID=1967502 RepID=A0A4Y8QBC8_9BACL|nr:metallophosphoesterase [Paenibacillus athensensis]MCD1257512.1 metallophosphoesterase [Paenibacillus athensensis]